MKAEIYIFGNFEDGYSQYPDNYTRDLFSRVLQNQHGESEIVFHHDNTMAYYTYVRRLSSNTCLGICVAYNDVMVNDFSQLFAIFEDVITYIAVSGEIVEFDNEGRLTTKVKQLYLSANELNKIADYLNSKLANIGAYSSKLPAMKYSVGIDEWKVFDYQQVQEIQQALPIYPYIQIIKDENYNSEALSGYSAKLKNLSSIISDRQREISQLNEKVETLTKQKKQFHVVILLTVLIAVASLIFALSIRDKNRSISHLQDYSHELNVEMDELEDDRDELSRLYNETKRTLSNLRVDHSRLQSQYDTLELISQNLSNQNDSLRSVIYHLNSTRNNRASSSSSTRTYTVGPSSPHSTNGYDRDYVLWLQAQKNLTIQSFDVLANKSGYITLGLYSSSHSLIDTKEVYVESGRWQTVQVNFNLYANQYYYLAIVRSNDISLCYHGSSDSEYNRYKSGSLRILGECQKGDNVRNTGYYQYFYNITYSY